MNAARFFLVTASMLVFSLSTSAQLVLTVNEMPGMGSTMTDYSTFGDQPLDLGLSGPNRTWTIPNYDWELGSTQTLVAPSSTVYGWNFPTASHCLIEDTTEEEWEYFYYRLAADGLYLQGLVGREDGDDVTVRILDQEAAFLVFPLTYLTSWTAVGRIALEVVPGVEIVITDSMLAVVDGWGTLGTPFGTWEALRLRVHHFERREFPQIPPELHEYYNYQWFTEDGFTGASMDPAGEDSGPEFAFGHVTVTISGAIDVPRNRGPVPAEFRVDQNYPNPFNPSTTLPITVEHNARVEIVIYDDLGRVVHSEEHAFGPGCHQIPFDGSEWASGTYFADVRSGAAQITRRMQLVK